MSTTADSLSRSTRMALKPPLEGRPDADLVALANEGDEGAFVMLYERHRHWVAAVALRLVGNAEDAMDVLRETFAKWVDQFPGSEMPADARSFLYRLVRAEVVGLLSKRRGHSFSEEALLGAIAAPSSATSTPDENLLLTAVSQMPALERELILMHVIDDMKVHQMATALEQPVGVVSMRLEQAMESLRKQPQVRRYFLAAYLDGYK